MAKRVWTHGNLQLGQREWNKELHWVFVPLALLRRISGVLGRCRTLYCSVCACLTVNPCSLPWWVDALPAECCCRS